MPGWDLDPWGGAWGYAPGTSSPGTIPLATYRLALAERSSSGLGDEIISDVMAAGAPFGAESIIKWTRQLNGGGTLEFTLPTDGDNVTPEIYAPGQRELHLYRDDGGGSLLVWSGRLWIADVSREWVRFMGIGWYETLRHREIGTDFYKVDQEQLDIAWDLIDYTQTQTGGDEGFTRNVGETPSGFVRTVLYCAEERQNIAAAIEDLAGADTGFDFEIDIRKRWKVWAPRRGTDLSDTVFLDGATTIQNFSYTVDATSVANEYAGIGSAADCEPIHYTIATDTTSQDRYGLMQASLSRPDLRQDGQLIAGLTREQLRLAKEPKATVQLGYPMELGGPTPVRLDFNLGDFIGVRASHGYATLSGSFRVLGYTVYVNQIGREFFELELDGSEISDVQPGTVFTPSVYEQTILADGPVAFWMLDETSGPTAGDQAGGYDGTYL